MNQFRSLLPAILLLVISTVSGQAVTVKRSYDKLTERWLEVSDFLKYYDGLSAFCEDSEFRKYTIELMGDIHHYDSIILDFLQAPQTASVIGEKEYKRTLKDIQKLEEKYAVAPFISFLRESCITRNQLERNKGDLGVNSGVESYDSQMIVLETHLARLLKHIDKRVLSIEKHIHRINPEMLIMEESIVSGGQ